MARDHLLLWAPVVFWAGGCAVDAWSSMLWFPPGWVESNPFAADARGGFVWRHAVLYDACWLAVMLLVGGILYLGLQCLSAPIAQAAFAAWFIAAAVGSYAAALRNLWIHLDWYHPVGGF